MTLIRKAQAGGALGYQWDEDGSVVEVSKEDATKLLRIGHAGFSEVYETEVSAELIAEQEREAEERREEERRRSIPINADESTTSIVDRAGEATRAVSPRRSAAKG